MAIKVDLAAQKDSRVQKFIEFDVMVSIEINGIASHIVTYIHVLVANEPAIKNMKKLGLWEKNSTFFYHVHKWLGWIG